MFVILLKWLRFYFVRLHRATKARICCSSSVMIWNEKTFFVLLTLHTLKLICLLYCPGCTVVVTSVHWSLNVTRSATSRYPPPSTSRPLTLTPSSALPRAWERNSGNIFPCEMPRSSRGVWRQCIVQAAKKGTACDEANSCWSQKNRHFLTPTSFLIGQHKTIPDQLAKRKRKKEKEKEQEERWTWIGRGILSLCRLCICSWKQIYWTISSIHLTAPFKGKGPLSAHTDPCKKHANHDAPSAVSVTNSWSYLYCLYDRHHLSGSFFFFLLSLHVCFWHECFPAKTGGHCGSILNLAIRLWIILLGKAFAHIFCFTEQSDANEDIVFGSEQLKR